MVVNNGDLMGFIDASMGITVVFFAVVVNDTNNNAILIL
jgi:hypothetical protein